MNAQRLDLGLDPLGVTQQQIALLTRAGMPKRAVGLVGAHVLDPDAHRAQARQRLQRVDVAFPVAAVPAARVALDRADQPDLLVVAQRRLAQPAAPGYILDGESCHASIKTHLKRFKSRARMKFRPGTATLPVSSACSIVDRDGIAVRVLERERSTEGTIDRLTEDGHAVLGESVMKGLGVLGPQP